MLLGTLSASLSGNLLTGKRTIATSQGRATIRAGEGAIAMSRGRVQLYQVRIFNDASSFNKFEIQKYYHNEPKFNGVE